MHYSFVYQFPIWYFTANAQRDLVVFDSAQGTLKDIARSSIHTILAACELEHKSNEVVAVPSPPICGHLELSAGGKASLLRGCCSTCLDSFVGDVVKKILDTKLSEQWLSLGL